MEKKEEFLEKFKTAIASTAKSISNIEDVQVIFGNQNLDKSKRTIRLPDLDNVINYTKTRALADSEALKIRYSNEKILKKYEPVGDVSKKLYAIAEKIRYEKLGSEEFKGIKENIHNYYCERLKNLDLKKNENKFTEAFENYLRVNILDLKNSKESEKDFKSFKKSLETNFKKKIITLKKSTNNQIQFNSLISEIISKMDIIENIENEKKNEEGAK